MTDPGADPGGPPVDVPPPVDPVEEKFTLKDAKRILRRGECFDQPHNLRIEFTEAWEPYILVCERCHRSWVAYPGDDVVDEPRGRHG